MDKFHNKSQSNQESIAIDNCKVRYIGEVVQKHTTLVKKNGKKYQYRM